MKKIYRCLPLFLILMVMGCAFDDNAPQQSEALYWEKASAGGYHTLAIRSDGTLWAWGSNEYGQLGDGTIENKLSPVQIGTDTDWASVSAGQYFSAALKENGHIFLWGINEFGQIGNGTYDNQLTPLQIGTDSWTKVDATQGSIMALRADGTIWAWGNNEDYQGGINATDPYLVVPTQIGTANDWSDISMGAFHAFAKKQNGSIYGWGASSCELGNDLDDEITTPQLIASSGSGLQIPSAYTHSMGLNANGKLLVAGFNSYGALGIPPTNQWICSFTQMGNADWIMIDAGILGSSGIKSDGSLWTWGWNSNGQLGFGDTQHRYTPTQLGTATNWKFVDIGGWYNVALNTSNELWCWGMHATMDVGQGTGPVAPYLVPCPQ